ncbi:caspase family protein [Bradyrhizobium sp. CCGE-LA001]|uniref:caspase family protein n=1 Tax=Bradyrhizobium sp. CCGE-LA001 TaxID=1223566 RepID=UPI000745DC31|nr:caspase domain-containing protein [Bradyrhizobium sp. CCGE-LA001]AMA58433.1 caspase-like domain-containing protein [Bradyrhizobium sp. CCGE-LA001]
MRGTYGAFFGLLLAIPLVAGMMPGPASAQQQEKRIALVVGNGAYAKSPLATTANDAGLIAQTLQAAGFDVVGARDLDGDTLRKSLRDFIQKAQASGPGTVAMIYLAGYGVQLAGENYFVPVDSNISRDTDIPTEALRISDYVRQLAAIPLKANIVVLDAARAQPFIEGGQPIASGLALVEPEANMLIAFNAAPGTVAPEEAGPYGIYAQSLAEMIRTGGLPLAEVFDRVRLRVNEASKGAQVPWNEQKITAQFSFFERGPDAPPPEAASDQVAAIRNKPIRDLGVQDAYAAALERDTLAGYEEFLVTYPSDPLAKRVRAIVAARREAITWRRTYRTDTPEAYWSYLRRYPRGPHAADARRRLAILTAPPEPPPTFAMIDYDVPPPPPEEVVYVDRPVLYFSDPDFGFAPPPPPPVYYLPPPPPDFVVLPPPLPVVGLFVLPQPVFVPIPVFVRPPVYVAPPPNNIIYQNIHNTTVINTVINRPPPPPPAGAGPGTGPANLAPAVAGRANPAGPAVPQAVVQRAALIQQGKVPMPPSATIQPIARPGIAAPAPANVAPATSAQPPAGAKLPQADTLPQANTPPSPGTPGAPPAGAGVAPGAITPNTGPTTTAPAGNAAATPQAPGAAKPPQASTPPPASTPPQANTLPVPGTPGGPPAPAGAGRAPGMAPSQGKPVATTTPPAGNIKPAQPNAATTTAPNQPPARGGPTPPSAGLPRPGALPPSATDPRGRPTGPQPGVLPPPSAAGKPGVPSAVRPATPPPPPVAAREPSTVQDRRPVPPPQAARPAPPVNPQALARPTAPPPPRVAPPPPPRAAPPPVAVARPTPPPPMARPAPPPPMARPAPPPPPVARPAPPPPPPVARAAPPPMVAAPPRPAPAPHHPPPRPAGPPPKVCPPGQKC